MKDTSRIELNRTRDALINEAQGVINKYNSEKCNEDIRIAAVRAIENIRSFRVKLAYHRGTESIEGNFEWTPVFDSLVKRLREIARVQ